MTIADRIIEKCGGVKATSELAGVTENWVYRWRLPKDRGGTGGEIPREAQKALLAAAADGKCSIEPADFFASSAAA